MQINSISNSQQKTQQNQLGFGAYTHRLSPKRLRNLTKQARHFGRSVHSGSTIIRTLNKYTTNSHLNRKNQAEFRKLTDGYLFNREENVTMIDEAIHGGFKALVNVAKGFIANAKPLPKEIVKSVEQMQHAEQKMNLYKKAAAKLQTKTVQLNQKIGKSKAFLDCYDM